MRDESIDWRAMERTSRKEYQRREKCGREKLLDGRENREK